MTWTRIKNIKNVTRCVFTGKQSHVQNLIELFLNNLLCTLQSAFFGRPHIHYVQISSLCMLLHITLFCWVGVFFSNKWPFAITCSKHGGWAYFQGWVYFQETTVWSWASLNKPHAYCSDHCFVGSCNMYMGSRFMKWEPIIVQENKKISLKNNIIESKMTLRRKLRP